MITELKPTNLIAVEVPEDSFGFYTTYKDKYTSLWLSEPKNEYESPFGKVNEPYSYFPALFETSRSEGDEKVEYEVNRIRSIITDIVNSKYSDLFTKQQS